MAGRNNRRRVERGMARPFTVVFSTSTLNGLIADSSGYSLLSCEEDFRLQHELRAWADAVMVGSNTVLRDDPRLTLRKARGRSPLRVVVDSRLRIPLTARIFAVPSRAVVVTSGSAPREKLERLASLGVRVIIAGGGRVDLREALRALHEEFGVSRLLVEGGGRLNCALLQKRLVDVVRITIAPRVFPDGVRVFHGSHELPCRADLALESVRVLCGGWVHLVYRVSGV